MNGSLWTLPVEVKCYAFVALFGLVGLIGRRPWGVAAVAVAFCLLTIQRVRDGLPHGDAIADLAGHGSEPLVLIAVFAVASLLFTIRDRLPLAWTPVLVALAVWAATIPLSGHRFATVLLLPYWVIGLAYLISWDGIRRALRGTDLSYGTYLYAFPMEQLVSTVFRPGPVLMIIVAAPLTLVCAAVSWMLIERPSLSLKPRGRAAPAAAQVTARA